MPLPLDVVIRLSRLLSLLVLATIGVWLVRVVNVFGDETLSGSSRLWRLLVATGFLVFAGVMMAVLSGRWAGHRLGSTRLVAMFCLWTMVFWAVRSIGILLGDYDTGFTLVHVVLAVVFVGGSLPVYRLDQRITRRQRPIIRTRSGLQTDR